MTLERTHTAPSVKPKNAPPIDERMSSDGKPNATMDAFIVGRVTGSNRLCWQLRANALRVVKLLWTLEERTVNGMRQPYNLLSLSNGNVSGNNIHRLHSGSSLPFKGRCSSKASTAQGTFRFDISVSYQGKYQVRQPTPKLVTREHIITSKRPSYALVP